MDINHRLEASRTVNLLPFISLPETISVVRLCTALRFRPPDIALSKAGIFIHNGDEIWSFSPLPVLMSAFDAMLDRDHCRSRRRAEVEADETGSRVLSWLLRKNFERFLGRFGEQGLHVENDANEWRAFFQGLDGKTRTISYGGSEANLLSRNVVVRRWGGRRPIFKNEGFGYQVLRLGGIWGVAIDPFYIFTGPQASKPLPYAVQIEHSSRWNGRDAKTGASHLAFWRDFLTGGASVTDLSQDGVQGLSLARSLMELPGRSVPSLAMPGLVSGTHDLSTPEQLRH
jgi:hypothetical protein